MYSCYYFLAEAYSLNQELGHLVVKENQHGGFPVTLLNLSFLHDAHSPSLPPDHLAITADTDRI